MPAIMSIRLGFTLEFDRKTVIVRWYHFEINGYMKYTHV